MGDSDCTTVKIELRFQLKVDNDTTQSMTTTGLKRNTIDKFYTKPEVADSCLDLIRRNLSVGRHDLIIEPSAGSGTWIPGIKLLSRNYLFFDIEPESDEIVRQDYLALDLESIERPRTTGRRPVTGNIHVVGNPPFGRQSSLAIKFVRKSCDFADSVSFILPKSFKKESLKHKVPLNFHLIFEEDLPDKSFIVGETEHDVPCVFQIWKKEEYEREVEKKLNPEHFVFVKKGDAPDIAVRRVGVNAGRISSEIEDKSPESHYFITFTNSDSVEDNIERVSEIVYEFNNTVGPKSISKQELIAKFNPLLREE